MVRKHPWRKQLYIKGRNMTVRQMAAPIDIWIGQVVANDFLRLILLFIVGYTIQQIAVANLV